MATFKMFEYLKIEVNRLSTKQLHFGVIFQKSLSNFWGEGQKLIVKFAKKV